MLGFALAWTCTGSVHAVDTSVSSYVQLRSCVQMTLFPYSYLLLLALILSSPLPVFCNDPELGGGYMYVRMSMYVCMPYSFLTFLYDKHI